MTNNTNDSENTPKREKVYSSREKQGFNNLIEIGISFFAINFILISGIFDSTFSKLLPNYYETIFNIPTLSKSLIITGGIVIFTVIYGISPFQLTLRRLLNPRFNFRPIEKTDVELKVDENINATKSNDISDVTSKLNESAENYLRSLIASSRDLSKNIYNRGSLYLLVGLICAFTGIAFFYTQTHNINASKKMADQILLLLPNFGVLFFLELVAFFFLRQYRSIMDEFRYYESIQRSREESLAIIKFTLESGKDVDLADVLEKLKTSSNSGKLDAGQTTEILESRKLDKSELETLTKIVETVASKIGQGSK